MPPKDWTIRIEDMIDATERIGRLTQGIDFEEFVASEAIVYSVLYSVQILGEASRHIPEDVQAQYSDVDWARMRGMRNILVHVYSAVRLDVVWNTVEHDVPPLIPRLREILELDRDA